MDLENVSCDLAKEMLTILAYCDSKFIDKIPDYIFKKLNDLAADSKKEFYINKNKTLLEQDITEECRDLLGYIYFTYMTNSLEKKEILNTIIEND